MRAAFLLSEVIADTDAAPAIQALAAAGLRPVVLAVGVPAWQAPAGLDVPVIACARPRPDCWDSNGDLLASAAARLGVSPGDAFVLGWDPLDVAAAADGGYRPVLVLGGRGLDDLFGDVEPLHKGACTAPDLETAVRHVLEEASQDAAVGPFPYGESVPATVRARTYGPSPRDLATILALITLAGVAIALGIAYLLQEVYQRATLPAAAYWITLQFIPQALRGLLFLALGSAVGMMVRPYLSRLRRRYRARRV